MKYSKSKILVIIAIIIVFAIGIISLIAIGISDEFLNNNNTNNSNDNTINNSNNFNNNNNISKSNISNNSDNSNIVGEIKWQSGLDSAIKEAKSSNKKVLIYFEASWCSYCRQMNEETFTNSKVQETINTNYISVAIDGDENPSLCSKYNVFSYPTIVILDPSGAKINEIPGFRSASELLNII
ncbi:MAG: thioredoxin family protein [Methanobacteriaceae archaeon]